MLKIEKWIPLFTTQFLGVLNDNVLKYGIIFISISWLASEEQVGLVVSIAAAFLVLPFVFFSPLAGRWSQTKSKLKIFEYSKLAEIPIMLIAVFGFYTESLIIVMTAMLLMGVQSALYSPSKYGLIRDIGGVEGVSFGVGTMELLTFIGALIGQVALGIISDLPDGSALFASILMLTLAISGWLSSKKIKAVEPKPTTIIKDTINPIKFLYQSYQWSTSIKGLNYTIFGLGSFWFVAAMLQLNIIMHAPGYYGMSNTQTSIVAALIAIGIGIGCWVAGLIAKNRVEIGMVPIGGFALSICLTIIATVDLSPTYFVIFLFIAAFFSGFYKVPLNAWIQQRVKGRKLGDILAYNNQIAFLLMLISAGIFGLVTTLLDTGAVFLVLALVTWIMTGITLLNIPSMMIKFIAGSLAKFYFKIKVSGIKHIPEKTGGLIISNHQSLIDPFIISAGIPRMVRFVMAKEIYENPLIHWLVKRLNVIPVSAKFGKEQLEEFTCKCQDEINKGHLVCIFPEGQISRIGHLLEFKKGVEFIAEGIEAPIIPLYLDGIDGIPFSFDIGSSKPILRMRSFKKQLSIHIGEPIHHRQSAFHLRQRVEELRADAFVQKISEKDALGSFFERIAKSNTTKAIISSGGKEISYLDLLNRAKALGEFFNKEFAGVKAVGICANATHEVYLLHVALAFAGIEAFVIRPESLTLQNNLDRCDLLIGEDKYLMEYKGGVKRYLLKDIISLVAVNKGDRLPNLSRLGKPKKHDFVMSSWDKNELDELVEVRLNHQNILASTKGLMQIFEEGKGKKILSTIPFQSAYGYSLNLWLPLLTGMTIVQAHESERIENLASTICSRGVDILFADHNTVHQLYKSGNVKIWESLETIVTGWDAVDHNILNDLRQQFDITVLQSVGFVDYGSVIAVNSPNHKLKDINGKYISQLGNKPNTLGRPLPGIALKIVDPSDKNNELGYDQTGNLLIKGASLSGKPFGKDNGQYEWKNTGFKAAVDQDGFLTIKHK